MAKGDKGTKRKVTEIHQFVEAGNLLGMIALAIIILGILNLIVESVFGFDLF